MKLPILMALALLVSACSSKTQVKKPAVREEISLIAFGSCMNQNKDMSIWDSILSFYPDLFLFMGDNVYADTDRPERMKQKYDLLGNNPHYQRFIERVPILSVWDDHDYGENDAGKEYRMKEESEQIFFEFFEIPEHSPRRNREGIYGAYYFGPPERRVQILLLDTRYFRDSLEKSKKFLPHGRYVATKDTSKTLLGEKQWQWLESQLKNPAKLRVIVTSIQFVARLHSWERWENFPHERQRLLDLIRSTQAESIIFLSGDRHSAHLYSMKLPKLYPIVEATSSSLNSPLPKKYQRPEPSWYRKGDAFFGPNFGLLRIDWKEQSLRLEIRDQEGNLQNALSLKLNELVFK